MDYLSQEIQDSMSFLVEEEKYLLRRKCYNEIGAARHCSVGGTTIDTIQAAVRKAGPTVYYTTSKLLPTVNGKGREIFFYIEDTNEYLFHPDNLNALEQCCAKHGIILQDIKKLYKEEQIGRLLRLQYLRQNTCCAYNRNNEVVNI